MPFLRQIVAAHGDLGHTSHSLLNLLSLDFFGTSRSALGVFSGNMYWCLVSGTVGSLGAESGATRELTKLQVS